MNPCLFVRLKGVHNVKLYHRRDRWRPWRKIYYLLCVGCRTRIEEP